MSELKPDESTDSKPELKERLVKQLGLALFYYGRKTAAATLSLALLTVFGLNLMTTPLEPSLSLKDEPCRLEEYRKSIEQSSIEQQSVLDADEVDDYEKLLKIQETINYEKLLKRARSFEPVHQDGPHEEPGGYVYMIEYSPLGDYHKKLTRKHVEHDNAEAAFSTYLKQRTLTRPYRLSTVNSTGEYRELVAELDLIQTANYALEANLSGEQRKTIIRDLQKLADLRPEDYTRVLDQKTRAANRFSSRSGPNHFSETLQHAVDNTWPFYGEMGTRTELSGYADRLRGLIDSPVRAWPENLRSNEVEASEFSTLRTGLKGDDFAARVAESMQKQMINFKEKQTQARCALTAHTNEQYRNGITGKMMDESCQSTLNDPESMFSDAVSGS